MLRRGKKHPRQTLRRTSATGAPVSVGAPPSGSPSGGWRNRIPTPKHIGLLAGASGSTAAGIEAVYVPHRSNRLYLFPRWT